MDDKTPSVIRGGLLRLWRAVTIYLSQIVLATWTPLADA